MRTFTCWVVYCASWSSAWSRRFVSVSLFCWLGFLHKPLKCCPWWEKGKPVVTQVCRQCCCSVLYFFIYKHSHPHYSLSIKGFVWSLISSYNRSTSYMFLFPHSLCLLWKGVGGTCIMCPCSRGHACNRQSECTSCYTLLHITNHGCGSCL